MTEIAIESYWKAGQFGDAAEVAERAGMTEIAIGMCWKAGRFRDAAKVAERAGMTKMAQTFFKAAKRANWPFW